MKRCFDVTSCLFRALHGFSMADTGVVETLLQRIEKLDGGVDSLGVAASLGVDHQVIVGAVKSLQALGDVISAELRSSKHWELTEEGTEIAEQGSHEARVFNSILLEGLPQAELMVESIEDQVREKLLLVKQGNAAQLDEKEKNELKKRKLLAEV
ncbi:hypothetical protein XENOCAPTIV_001815 [Xenoophorus captivus]|uniref:Phenylalanine--tRNA ligase alpha subunit n=1 Tax=Xenoophorus captivus TaxID=1517983 RepID=A0ABV0S1B5_9TELE